jgi:hypothetical protein
MPDLRAGSQNKEIGRAGSPARVRAQKSGRRATVVLIFASGMLAVCAAHAESGLPPEFFPGVPDPFAVIPGDKVPSAPMAPLLTPMAPPARPLPPPAPPLQAAVQSQADQCVRRDYSGRFMGWMDYKHCIYSGRTLATARWFDDLFGDWHEDEASMQLRIITQVTSEEFEGASMKVTVRASAELPNARRRVRLIVSDENDPEEVFNREAGTGTRRNRQLRGEDNRSSAALRWSPFSKEALDTTMDVGVRGVDPPDLFVRARARKTWSLTQDSIARVAQTFRYGSESKERSVTQIDFERAMDENSVLRFSNTYDYFAPRNSEGFYWAHTLSLSHAFRRARSLSYGVSLGGPTQPNWVVESYGPWMAFRRPFLRPYLFYEVEPRYSWYRDLDWEGRASLTVRVEMQVGFKK